MKVEFETIDGRWWLFENGEKVKPLTDQEAVRVIWGTGSLDITCPFCGESEFDKQGLKYHLHNYCEEYQKVEELYRL